MFCPSTFPLLKVFRCAKRYAVVELKIRLIPSGALVKKTLWPNESKILYKTLFWPKRKGIYSWTTR